MSKSQDFVAHGSYDTADLYPSDLMKLFAEMVAKISDDARLEGYVLDWGGFSIEQDVNSVDARSFRGESLVESYGSLYMEVRGIKIDS